MQTDTQHFQVHMKWPNDPASVFQPLFIYSDARIFSGLGNDVQQKTLVSVLRSAHTSYIKTDSEVKSSELELFWRKKF